MTHPSPRPFNNRFRERAFYGPALTKPSREDSCSHIQFLRPIPKSLSATTKLYNFVVALVIALLLACGPSQISRNVSRVVIPPVDGNARLSIARQPTKIGYECARIIDPVWGYLDSAPSVSTEAPVVRVVAPVFNTGPERIFACVSKMVSCPVWELDTQTAAAFCVSTLGGGSCYLYGVSAVAPESPFSLSGLGPPNESNGRQAAEFLARNFEFGWHVANSTPLPKWIQAGI